MDFYKRKVNKSKPEDTKLVGAVVPTNIFYYLNLFCVADQSSKSSILRPLIEEWYEKATKQFSEKELLNLAAEMGYKSFRERKNKRRPFSLVIQQQEKELRKKGVSEKHIAKILDKIDSMKLKDDVQRKIARNKKNKT